jgi:hypothetical protein
MRTDFSRALIPVRRDPLEVEVDHGPQDVSDPRAIFLFGLEQPLAEFDQVGDAERRAIYPCVSAKERAQKLKIPRTRGGGADAGLLIENPLKLDTKYRLVDATGEYVPCQADYLLRSGESVDNIVQLGAQTLVPEYGELVEPRVVDEAGIAQPVDRELGVVRIGDDGSNHANLQYGVSLGSRNGFEAKAKRSEINVRLRRPLGQ